ncbi:bifunctional transcriptional activator/DNA repair enzyme AdaA [Bryobacter aggregatus]|uniref:bifunctional transcriptional activator/DNA repair enzyme AdaA n=1 Tax=Bryobacter aggregatus TaxID=360054 RepID=UPI00056B51EB|nr:methylated-DNA--[protein]-cysteine S-methyltransferase [Bryobacter aggregatus]
MIPIDPIAYLSQYLRDHCDETISLDDMARITGYSAYHLQRKFKAALGVSPKQFQARCRMERMKSALRHNQPVTTALYEAGFGSASRLYERVDSDLGMTPAQYKARGKGIEISYVILGTVLGKILIAATDRGLCSLQLADRESELRAALQLEFPAAQLTETLAPFVSPLKDWQEAIEAFVAGKTLAAGLPMDIRATAFQATVWQYLQTIPAGETRSYAEVAAGIGHPTATRAVARACASNPVALAIPCHRVIRNNGELGGYRWGLNRKQRLLELEARDTDTRPASP